MRRRRGRVVSGGGDGFPAFNSGANKVIGGLDIDGFAAYLLTVSPYSPFSGLFRGEELIGSPARVSLQLTKGACPWSRTRCQK